MYGNIEAKRQGVRYRLSSTSLGQWKIAVLLILFIAFSALASILYSSPFPFFLALTALLLIPITLIIIYKISPEAFLGIHVFSRLILDSVPGITYKKIIGPLSFMDLYSTSIIAFGLVFLTLRKELKLNWLLVLFLILLGAQLATTLYHQNWVDYLGDTLKWVYLWLIINFTRLSIKRIDFKRLCIIILVLYLYPIVNFLYSVVAGIEKCTDGLCRFIGTYSHQGVFSFIMLTIIPAALYLLIVEKRTIKRSFYAIIMVLAHIGIYNSSYRTTWMALSCYWLVTLVIFIIYMPLPKKILITFFPSMIIVFFLVSGSSISDKVIERLAPLAGIVQAPFSYLDMSSSEAYRVITGNPYVAKTKENLTLTGRIGIWKALMVAYSEAPAVEKILGMGVGKEKEIMAPYRWGGRGVSAHNMYIKTFVETGVLGFTALAILVLTIFSKITSRLKQYSLPIIVAAPIFFAYLTCGLASTVLSDMRLLLCLGLYVGIALYYRPIVPGD